MGEADDARDAVVEEMDVDGGDRHRGKDKERRDRHRREEKDHHGSGRRDKEKEKDKDERRRDKDDTKHRDRERERERDRDRDRDSSKHRDRDSERDRGRDRDRGKDRERDTEREREREKERRDRDKDRSRNRDKNKDKEDREREKSRGKDRGEDADLPKGDEGDQKKEGDLPGEPDQASTSALRDRIARAKEERLKDKKEGGILDDKDDASEILSWVGKSRKLDEKRQAEKEKALRLARVFEEQDDMLAENSDDDYDEADKLGGDHLSGVKVLHGLDKVIEGGAVVMTLKDQSILADGDINEEADMLENIEIGEQKQRNEAYRAAHKKGTYDDKFNDDPMSKKPMLSQYDDPMEDEGVTLDEGGRFTGEAEKKLEELRKRIEGGSVLKKTEDLTSAAKMASDYYTADEMLQFKKPKKKKSHRKKEKLDLDALEAEAIASGLGAADLGSRNNGKRQSAREVEQKADAEKRSNAYQVAISKAEEASKALRQEKMPGKPADEEELVFGDDYEDLQKSLEQARKLSLRKQEEAAGSGPLSVAEMAAANKGQGDADAAEGDAQQNKVVITEMEEFVWGLQLNEETRKPEAEDVFMDEDDDDMPSGITAKDDTSRLGVIKEEAVIEDPKKDVEEQEVTPDEVVHEAAVGKGLGGALKFLKERGTLNEGTNWGGRTTDKKKSKLVGIEEEAEDGKKEIRIERMDEFGRVMTPKEAFRDLSHKFHGKGPGKMKLEKRQKKYQDDMKAKQMKSSDTPLMSAEKMRDAQARGQTPYLVLSGNAKSGPTGDASGFASVEKAHPGSLTPMLGDKKVEHFLGIKRSAQFGGMPPLPPKKPKN
ncbi:SART-1 family protein DOT2 [Triticum dicoccoides]|uniref:SART-1 family protein DOT2 n=1 Tax=Triticum dicoccoides TaxID=85692 RepID=UPI000E79DA44|nr:SART-1 family protein DOT2 [Triticum dicoccoides]XP_037488098.1 SART-1 family protein DOT2 [Triticum dicoccoides]